jgi:hypothetical protein
MRFELAIDVLFLNYPFMEVIVAFSILTVASLTTASCFASSSAADFLESLAHLLPWLT